MLIQAFKLLPFLAPLMAEDLSSTFFTSGFLHRVKFLAPSDPIAFHVLKANNITTSNRIKNQFSKKQGKLKLKLKLIWFTFRSNHGAVEKEVIEIGSEKRKTTFASVAFKRSVDDRSDEIFLERNEPDRTGATQNRNADQNPVPFSLVLLLLVVEQHLRHNKKKN